MLRHLIFTRRFDTDICGQYLSLLHTWRRKSALSARQLSTFARRLAEWMKRIMFRATGYRTGFPLEDTAFARETMIAREIDITCRRSMASNPVGDKFVRSALPLYLFVRVEESRRESKRGKKSL